MARAVSPVIHFESPVRVATLPSSVTPDFAANKGRPLVIQWFEDLDARYPGNPMVLDKLYVSYLEDGHRRRDAGDLAGARMRFDQAAQYDPDRGVAQQLLDELDEREAAGR